MKLRQTLTCRNMNIDVHRCLTLDSSMVTILNSDYFTVRHWERTVKQKLLRSLRWGNLCWLFFSDTKVFALFLVKVSTATYFLQLQVGTAICCRYNWCLFNFLISPICLIQIELEVPIGMISEHNIAMLLSRLITPLWKEVNYFAQGIALKM